YGIRTDHYKLIYYYGDPLDVKGAVQKKTEPEWELFDLDNDPMEMKNVYADAAYTEVVAELKEKLTSLRGSNKEEQKGNARKRKTSMQMEPTTRWWQKLKKNSPC